VPSVKEKPHTPRPLPARGKSKTKARGFKEKLTHSLLETREQRQEMAEEVQALLEEEARQGPVKKPTKKVNQKKLTADQRFRLFLQEHQEQLSQGTFLSLDVETTDNSTVHGRVIELGLTAFMGWREVKRWCWRFDPQGRRIGRKAFQVHGIGDAELRGQPLFADKAQLIHQLMHRAGVVVAHNLPYDKRMLGAELERAGLGWPEGVLEICTAQASKSTEPGRKSHKLDSMCAQFQIQLTNHHAAEDDARACGLLWRRLYNALTGLEVDASAREEVA
jgi:DNA polymerase III epsilon subunit-like protein